MEANELAERRFGEASRRLQKTTVNSFRTLDLVAPGIIEQTFPDVHFDVIMCHDAIQHDPRSNVRSIPSNFDLAGDRLVLDVDKAGRDAADIATGDFPPLGITESPYGYEPECMDKNTFQKDFEQEHFAIFKLPLPVSA
mmetsp:Transcript_63278/g.205394  ORF Transcript_63278/g.205394 Transcript_63278/m.205394 type:complete len:139 (-) Transcript_63278:19-435(-)